MAVGNKLPSAIKSNLTLIIVLIRSKYNGIEAA